MFATKARPHEKRSTSRWVRLVINHHYGAWHSGNYLEILKAITGMLSFLMEKDVPLHPKYIILDLGQNQTFLSLTTKFIKKNINIYISNKLLNLISWYLFGIININVFL